MSADTRTPWGSTIITEVVTSLAGVEPPTWMDISDRVSFRDLGQVTVTNGRQSDLSGDEPAQLSIAFRDDDHLFTVGDILRTGRRLRIRESFGLATFDLIDAEIQVPSTSTAMDVADATHQAEITVTVTATDQLGRLRDARQFISTLTEYIRFTGGSSLQYFWPMLDASAPFANVVGTSAPLKTSQVSIAQTPATVSSDQLVRPASAPPVFADDRAGVLFAPSLGVLSVMQPVQWGRVSTTALNLVCNNDTITLAFWLYCDTTSGALMNPLACVLENSNFADAYMGFQGNDPTWQAIFAVAALGGTLTLATPVPRFNAWNLIALQMTLPSGACTAFIHNLGTVTGNLAGSFGASQSFEGILAGHSLIGSVTDVQVYLGAGAYTQATHNAQILAATTGLEQQLTGERVNTILDYAGVPAGTRDIDPGVATMSVARLAGKDPLTCLEEARRTEQGRLFSTGSFGSRRIQFRDRQRSYNN